jgi:imidazolonepropionase-like amidohydrolase
VRRCALGVLAGASVALGVAACDRFQRSDAIVLEGVTLIDGSGGPPVLDAVIVIRAGHIESVARVNEIALPRGATVLNLLGKTVIPGLIDVHAHVTEWTGPRFLAWGVTTVRDLSDDSATAYTVKRRFNDGSALGPRVFTSGGVIDGRPAAAAAAEAVSTPDEGRRAVDRRAVSAADWLKVYTGVTPDVLAAILDEATSFRLPTAAHLGRIDALTAARAGVASVEHLSGVVAAAVADPAAIGRAWDDPAAARRVEARAWAQLDSARLAAVAGALAETHVSIVPTLVANAALARLADTAFIERRAMADVPAAAAEVRDAAAFRARLGWTPADGLLFAAARPAQALFLREFRKAGGLMGAGSNAASPLLVPGFSLHEELALLVDAGFAPLSTIATATRRNAQLLRADSLGWIAPGKVADLVILNARPDSNILATRDIHLVVSRGRLIDPDSLRAAWPR